MDPDAALQLCRRVTRLVLNEQDHNDIPQLANELAEGFDALDQWISRGGFLPKGWNIGRVVCENKAITDR